ncbi:hypothetical protein [Kibdelosporangium phytohabitans]|uniref:Uncharacterized protein n=1 Tax=Kibdelosporangium phytohabitans TaxID=860235 RepID=A0A0N7F3G8_9PSEU|nr:hypothetical protein [Kibdelosporangium phytohabitans]ALG08591.1 hypothetical protein AOZ06_18185 [Kibdelosporangium phytohabitans]MBE1470327.1 hypothetical protein [Kibdelosporangium phytohabitans]
MLNMPGRGWLWGIRRPARTRTGAIIMVVTSAGETLSQLRDVVRIAARSGRHVVLALPMPATWGFEIMGPVPAHQNDDYEIDWFLTVAPLMTGVSWDIEPVYGSVIKLSRVLAARHMADTVLLSARHPLRCWWWSRRLGGYVRVLSMREWIRAELGGD